MDTLKKIRVTLLDIENLTIDAENISEKKHHERKDNGTSCVTCDLNEKTAPKNRTMNRNGAIKEQKERKISN